MPRTENLERARRQSDAFAPQRSGLRARQRAWLCAVLGLGACADVDSAEEAPAELDEQKAALAVADGGVIVVPSFDGGGFSIDASGPPGGPPGDGGPSSFGPVGLWHFDDCRAASTILLDSSPSAANAVKSATVTCKDGIAGKGLLFDERGDTVQTANAQAFTLGSAVTVAAWINPQAAARGSIVNKEKPSALAFELSFDGKKVTFSVTVQKKKG
ncbi:MAG: hypothetical protein JWN04_3308, partial [Myxococcaceae bacterium]|nr:hypothetical protein [Myxococcaceae bacterium]